MALKGGLLRSREALQTTFVVAACIAIWIWRRPEQLTRPYVWVEESQIIRHFLEDGWAGAFHPIQGYLILPANVLVALSTDLSFLRLPGLMYVFAVCVFVATVLLLVRPDSRWGDLNVRSAMAFAMVLVPTNPEIFGVLLYSFWWSTLWPLIILGWKRNLWLLRAPLLAVGALSSPAAGALFPLYGVAYLRNRRLRELVSSGILLAGLVVQIVIALDSTRAELLSRDADPRDVFEQTVRTPGLLATRWLSPASVDENFVLLVGTAFIAFLVIAALRLAFFARRDEALLLTLAAGIFTVLSAVPAPLISSPTSGGPRYYFLPFVAMSWVLLTLWRDVLDMRVRVASAALLAVALLGLATTFSRTSEERAANLSWREEIRDCGTSPAAVVPVPIYFDGSQKVFWSLTLTPARCRELSR
jgi:hypothetical protein